jgi:hypothetical protein
MASITLFKVDKDLLIAFVSFNLQKNKSKKIKINLN